MQKTKLCALLLLLTMCTQVPLLGQMTLLRKNIKHQETRNKTYSERSRFFTNVYQIGNLVRNTDHDSLSTAKGLSSWIYGWGTGAVIPIVGPAWLNVEAVYQYRNYKMRSDDKSLLAQVDRLQKHKIAVHTIDLSAYLRLSTSRNSILQGKYIEIGYSYGFNFANRLLVFQDTDPAQTFGATQVKNKFKNTEMIAKQAQHLCFRVGREHLTFFTTYRISDFFRRSSFVYGNQKLPELSKFSVGLTIILNDSPDESNTDENEPIEE